MQHMDLQNIQEYTGMQLIYGFGQCKEHWIHRVKGCKGLVTQLAQALKQILYTINYKNKFKNGI